MLGISGGDESHTRPMTAQLEADEGGPIWFFTAMDNDLVQQLRGNDRAVATFASKDHNIFAAVHGSLRADTVRKVVDRLWNRFVAAWYEGGEDDPKLALLRLHSDAGQVCADASRFMAGSRCLLGSIRRRNTRTRSQRSTWTSKFLAKRSFQKGDKVEWDTCSGCPPTRRPSGLR